MVPFRAIPGTWSWDGDTGPDEWQHPGSRFHQWMRAEGLAPLFDYPFVWASCIDGVNGKDLIWEAAAYQLARELERVPVEWRNLVAHSHGGTVAIYLAADHIPINRLVTVGTPVRRRTEELGAEALAKGRIAGWWHVHAQGGWWADKMAFLGGLFDGRWSTRRWFKVAGVQNVSARDIDHSRVLHEREPFGRVFIAGNVCAFLRGEIPAVAAQEAV